MFVKLNEQYLGFIPVCQKVFQFIEYTCIYMYMKPIKNVIFPFSI